MALSASTLSTLMQDAIKAKQNVTVDAKLIDICDALAESIVDHITGAGVVAMANGGIDSNGDTLVTNEGSIS